MSDHNFFLVIRASLISFVETFGSFLISKDRISEYVSCFNRWSSTSTSGKILFLLHDVSIEYNFRKLVFKLFCLILLLGKSSLDAIEPSVSGDGDADGHCSNSTRSFS
ncbi:hypothetical protein AWRI1631_121410 [Saccharomyces cerevisiae AWRI1631]|uniref:Uncharacterized protein n=1 Tax=Saccharomyces cerevisiae (strain AWRI1631) TaxID=545124 RepID=B5VN30_YEAS6|nr:hypothetical protein AWRI1631_121410 [Saccharomyces cerevisiae AWRI1631]